MEHRTKQIEVENRYKKYEIRIERLLKNKEKMGKLHKAQVETLKNYHASMVALGKRKPSSMWAILYSVYRFAAYVRKPFNKVIKQDIINYLADVKAKGTATSPATLANYAFDIKLFFKWLCDEDDYPEVVKWIPRKRDTKRAITSSTILTREEVKRLIVNMRNLKYKLITSLLYQCALRIEELFFLRLKSITFHEEWGEIVVTGKSGERTLTVINSYPYLNDYLRYHPKVNDPNAFLISAEAFKDGRVKANRESMKIYYRKILRRAAVRAKITKKVFPHLLRHSKLTHLGEDGWTERALRIFAGWSQQSNMVHTYLHFGYESNRDRLLEENGIISKKLKQAKKDGLKALKTVKCPRCEQLNPSESKYCHCGFTLANKEAGQLQQIHHEAMNDPEVQRAFINFIKRKNLA